MQKANCFERQETREQVIDTDCLGNKGLSSLSCQHHTFNELWNMFFSNKNKVLHYRRWRLPSRYRFHSFPFSLQNITLKIFQCPWASVSAKYSIICTEKQKYQLTQISLKLYGIKTNQKLHMHYRFDLLRKLNTSAFSVCNSCNGRSIFS